MGSENIQKWAFIVGLVVAVIAGFVPNLTWVPLVLFVAGLIIGFLNIDDEEVVTFLVAAIALGVIGSSSLTVLSSVPLLSSIVDNLQLIVSNVIAFVGAAGLVVAVKAVIAIGKD